MLIRKTITALTVNDDFPDYPNLVVSARVLLQNIDPVTNLELHTGFYEIPILYDSNNSYAKFEDLTEEQVVSWLPQAFIDEFVESIKNTQERPQSNTRLVQWVTSSIIPVTDEMLACVEAQAHVEPAPLKTFEEAVETIVNKILREKGLTT